MQGYLKSHDVDLRSFSEKSELAGAAANVLATKLIAGNGETAELQVRAYTETYAGSGFFLGEKSTGVRIRSTGVTKKSLYAT